MTHFVNVKVPGVSADGLNVPPSRIANRPPSAFPSRRGERAEVAGERDFQRDKSLFMGRIRKTPGTPAAAYRRRNWRRPCLGGMTLSAIKNTIGSTPAGPPACQHAPAILRGRGRMIGSLDRWRDKTDGRGGASGVRAGTEVLRLVYLEHRAVLWVCIGYIGVGGALLRMLHRPWPIELTDHVFATVWMTASTLWLLWRWVQSPRRLRSALIAPRVCGAALVALLAVPTQITFQSLK